MTQVDASLARKRSKAANQARILSPVKFCGGCGKTKDKSQFGKAKDRSDGLRGHCKDCHKSSNRKWTAANPEKMSRLTSEWAKKNPDRVREKYNRWRNKNPEKARASYRSWRDRNLESERERSRRKNIELFNSVDGRINIRIGNGIRSCLKSGKEYKSTFDILPYSLEELRSHIERQFTNGMNWDAFMRGEIHIDHIRPLAQFEFTTYECPGFKQAWALTNLRPLWARDNMTKNARRIFLI